MSVRRNGEPPEDGASLGVGVLCRPAVAPAFRAAGLPVVPARTGEEATERLERIGRSGEPGLILVERSLHDALAPELRRRIDRSVLPVVVPFPGPVWVEEAPAEEFVVELLRRSIGYRVRLR